MKIRAKVLIRTESAFLPAGVVGECIDDMAKRLIAAGMAEEVVENSSEKVVEKEALPTRLNDNRKSKRR